ncbi:hypothetical protein RUM44_007399 [Polyplax serrata]|uniref:Uncharacterized protein n=1 Tax=Polyplax serrata TaxID=468196 RepID=A0ABR1B0J9_POLSC
MKTMVPAGVDRIEFSRKDNDLKGAKKVEKESETTFLTEKIDFSDGKNFEEIKFRQELIYYTKSDPAAAADAAAAREREKRELTFSHAVSLQRNKMPATENDILFTKREWKVGKRDVGQCQSLGGKEPEELKLFFPELREIAQKKLLDNKDGEHINETNDDSVY